MYSCLSSANHSATTSDEAGFSANTSANANNAEKGANRYYDGSKANRAAAMYGWQTVDAWNKEAAWEKKWETAATVVAFMVALVCSHSVHDELLALKTTPRVTGTYHPRIPQTSIGTSIRHLALAARQPLL